MKFDLQKNFEKRNLNENITSEKWKDLLKVFDYSNQSMTKEEIEKWVDTSSPAFRTETLSQSEMFEDFEQIIFLIKNLYVGYKIFGEQFFEKSFSKIEKFIQSHPSATPDEFASTICEGFKGVKDAHFSVRADNQHWHRPSDLTKEHTFYNASNFIEEVNGEFYLNGHKIILINGKNPKDFIQTVCTPKGNLKLGFVARLPNKQKSAKISCLMENGKTTDILLTKKDFKQFDDDVNFGEIKKINNCLYIKNSSSVLSYSSKKELEDFDKFIAKIKNLNKNIDFYVIDVRGNEGGNDNASCKIIDTILGLNDFSYEIKFVDLCSRYPYESGIKDNKNYTNCIWKEYQKSLKQDKPYIKLIFERPKEKVKTNNKPVFVINDNNTASAGEAYSLFYSHLPNVIFINDNTCGARCYANVNSYSLKNSKIKINFGSTFFAFNNFIEEKGFSPDIYFACQNKYVLQTMKNFIKKNIKTKNNDKEK